MLQWHTGKWKHRAYWGENLIPFGNDNSTERRIVGRLAGDRANGCGWKSTAEKVGIKPGTVINGWAFTQFDGTVYWDKAGIVTQTPQGDQPFDTLSAWVARAEGRRRRRPAASTSRRSSSSTAPSGTRQQKKQLRDYFMEHAYAKTRPTFAPLRQQIAALEKERDRIDKETPATLVFKERADAEAGVHPQARRVRPAAATRSAATRRVSCRRCRTGAPRTGSAWRNGWCRRIIR